MPTGIDANWKIQWRAKDGIATHSSSLQIRVLRSGWATVVECPPQVSELQATILMAELQRLLTDEKAHWPLHR